MFCTVVTKEALQNIEIMKRLALIVLTLSTVAFQFANAENSDAIRDCRHKEKKGAYLSEQNYHDGHAESFQDFKVRKRWAPEILILGG